MFTHKTGKTPHQYILQQRVASVPVYLFFGGADPFIPQPRIQQLDAQLQELDKNYRLKVYPDADHGFFCHERSSYNQSAAEDA